MKKSIFFYFAFLFFLRCITLSAQKLHKDFGDINPYKIEIAQEVLDKDPAAIVLFDKGRSYFSFDDVNGFSPCFERHFAIKILRKEGYELANHKVELVQFRKEKENLAALKGFTYVNEGTKRKLDKSQVFEEETNNRKITVKFAMPGITEGAIIEVYYRVESPFLSQLRDWNFQTTVPILTSEFEVSIPQYFVYNRTFQGAVRLSAEETRVKNEIEYITSKTRTGWYVSKTSYEDEKFEFKTYIDKWIAKEVEPFEEEPFLTGMNDFLSKVQFEFRSFDIPGRVSKRYGTTWENINEELVSNGYFGKMYDKNNKKIKDLYASFNLSGNPFQKLQKIHQYLVRNYSWNGEKTLFATQNINQTIENKKGSNADLNFLLIALLKQADIEVSPVVTSTRDHGRVKVTYPMMENLNYVFAWVEIDGKVIKVDVSHPKLKMGEIPFYCLNNVAWKVSEVNSGWITIESGEGIYTVAQGLFEIEGNGMVKGNLKLQKKGYGAFWTRETIAETGAEKYIQEEIVDDLDCSVLKSNIENLNNPEAALLEEYEVQYNPGGWESGLIAFNPLLFLNVKENPFKQVSRKYPVNFGASRKKVLSINFKIPQNFQVEQLPSNVSVSLPNKKCSFKYTSAVKNQEVQVYFKLEIEDVEFSPDEYGQLKNFYSQVIGKNTEKLILKKVDN